MAQHYSDPAREPSPYTLPDIETFEITATGTPWEGADGERLEPGWYWWSCTPGCLPDSEPFGPYDTEADALADAQIDLGGDDDGDDQELPQAARKMWS